ncbi:MAG: helix-turn-helix transcriptional regulator [Puia sp.]|nr:helix-turn-helix transcriptional regulator [Puia sp.]
MENQNRPDDQQLIEEQSSVEEQGPAGEQNRIDKQSLLKGKGKEKQKQKAKQKEKSQPHEAKERKTENTEVLENVLMRFCRESKKHTSKELASYLGVSADVYKKMEKGDLLISYKQAGLLGIFYEVNPAWFYKEAVQLDLLLTRMAIIKILKHKNDLLMEKLKDRGVPDRELRQE